MLIVKDFFKEKLVRYGRQSILGVMDIYKYVGQAAYGSDNYSAQSYGCDQNQVCTTQAGGTNAGAPNTGFFGSSDAVFATVGGALLVAIGIVGVALVVISRLKRRSTRTKEQ